MRYMTVEISNIKYSDHELKIICTNRSMSVALIYNVEKTIRNYFIMFLKESLQHIIKE